MIISRRISLYIYLLFLIVSNGLVLFSFDDYSILSHTTSHLGAQGSPNAWAMNIIFICLGGMSIWVTYHSKIKYHQILGMIFGFSLMLTGIFQHAPLIDGIDIDQQQDLMHSIFASITGFSFTLLAAGHGFMTIKLQRIVGIAMALLALSISLSMFYFPSIMGLLQRIMFVSAFGWLFFYMNPPKNRQNYKNYHILK